MANKVLLETNFYRFLNSFRSPLFGVLTVLKETVLIPLLDDKEVDQIKKKYGSRLKSVGDENMRLKVEKERLNSEMKKIESTAGVPRTEYNKVKRQADMLKKRMSQFAMVFCYL